MIFSNTFNGVMRAARSFGLLCAVSLGLVFGAQQAEAVSVSASATEVEVGDTFTVSLDFSASDQIGAIDAIMTFDTSLVSRTSADAGSVFDNLTVVDYLVTFSESPAGSERRTTLFSADQTGPDSFLVLTFEALGVGTAVFGASGETSNIQQNPLIPFSLSTSVNILSGDMSAIPLPASGLLLVFGMSGLMVLRRRS